MSSEAFYRTKEFLKLQKHWYNLLSRSGFRDAETFLPKYGWHSQDYLKRPCKDLGRKYKSDTYDHYLQARHFYNYGKFKENIDKIIWYYYSEGLSLREIAKEIKNINVNRTYFWVFTKLKALKLQFREFLIAEAVKESADE